MLAIGGVQRALHCVKALRHMQQPPAFIQALPEHAPVALLLTRRMDTPRRIHISVSDHQIFSETRIALFAGQFIKLARLKNKFGIFLVLFVRIAAARVFRLRISNTD